MQRISIFIPAFNAENHLREVISRIPAPVWDSSQSIWVVNDGSTDRTESVVRSLMEEHPKMQLISFPHNRGYGAAVKAGLAAAVGDEPDYAVCLHADGQYPPEYIPRLLGAATEENLHLIQGSRHLPGTALQGGMPLYKFIAGKALTALENLTFGLRLTDYHSGYLCYHKRTFSMPFKDFSDSFEFDLEVIACASRLGLRIGEVGIPTRYADEVSHLPPMAYGLRVLRVCWRYLLGGYRPCD